MQIDIAGLLIELITKICLHRKSGDAMSYYQRNRVRILARKKASYKSKEIDKRNKAISQLDIITGEIIAEYSSITLAAKSNLIHKTSISHALKHNNGILRNIGIKFQIKEESA